LPLITHHVLPRQNGVAAGLRFTHHASFHHDVLAEKINAVLKRLKA
jgi:hypothetical protein